MASSFTRDAAAQLFARASIANSLLLPLAAALEFNVTFWVLAMSNFVLMHAVWLTQLARVRSWSAVDFRIVKWPLVAFAVFGNFALLAWGDRLTTAFAA